MKCRFSSFHRWSSPSPPLWIPAFAGVTVRRPRRYRLSTEPNDHRVNQYLVVVQQVHEVGLFGA